MLVKHNEVTINTDKLTFWAFQIYKREDGECVDLKFYFRDAGSDINIDLLKELPFELAFNIRRLVSHAMHEMAVALRDEFDLALAVKEAYEEVKAVLGEKLDQEDAEAQIQSEAN
mgnify:CR=1 FL=1